MYNVEEIFRKTAHKNKLISLVLCLSVVLASNAIIGLIAISQGNLPYKKDFLQDYLMAKAFLAGLNPYLPISELAKIFIGQTGTAIFPHPSPHNLLSILIFLPLGFFNYFTACNIWLGINLFLLLLISLDVTKRFQLSAVINIIIFNLALSSYPILTDLITGQVNILIGSLFYLFFRYLEDKQIKKSSLCLAFIFALKYQAIFLFLFFLLSKQYRIFIYSTFNFLFLNLLNFLIFGEVVFSKYFFEIAPKIGGYYKLYFANQSLFTIVPKLSWGLRDYTPTLTANVSGEFSLSFSAVLLLSLILFSLIYQIKEIKLKIYLLIALSLIVLPVTWTHYFSVLIICLPFVFVETLKMNIFLFIILIGNIFYPYAMFEATGDKWIDLILSFVPTIGIICLMITMAKMYISKKVVNISSLILLSAILIYCSIGFFSKEFTKADIGANDFIEYYSAHTLYERSENPYDANKLFEEQQRLGQHDSRPLMMWNPPWIFVVLKPVLIWNFSQAIKIWLVINFALGVSSLFLIWNTYSNKKEDLFLGALALCIFLPFFFNIKLGQLGAFLCFLLCLYLWAFKNGHKFLTALSFFLFTLKPHIFFLHAIYLLYYLHKTKDYKLLSNIVLVGVIFISLTYLDNPSAISFWLRSFSENTSNPLVINVESWQTATVVNLLRNIVSALTGNFSPVLLVLVPGISAIAFLYFLIRRGGSFNYIANFPTLVLLNYLASPYGWIFDQMILLVSVLAILFQMNKEQELRDKTSKAFVIVLFVILNLIFYIYPKFHNQYVWYAVSLAIIYFTYPIKKYFYAYSKNS
ncbi:MAG: DUF2029 domain-containing protein [Proteobacteria bacterium]|nr:DUF2029 domain-containing protein [Pseudomonadota bacterium]